MKRVGFLFEQIVKIENLELAIRNASRKKRKRKNVQIVLDDIEGHAKALQEMLVNNKYKSSPYTEELIIDESNRKERLIKKPKFFPDQCVQWAIMQITEPVIGKCFYEYSCGSVPNKGTHHAKKYIEKWIKKDPRNTKYVLQIDVAKYYPSINHDKLNHMLSKKIKDKKVLDLFNEIIRGGGDGLPIGNYTSQWLANFYLTECDHFIKQELQAKYYIRYMDDIVIMGSNKRKLHKIRTRLENYLNKLDLKIKPNWQVYRLDCRPLDFLGFKFYRTHTTLRSRNALRIRRRVKKIAKKEIITFKDASAILSYMGWIKHSNSYYFYHKYIRPYLKLGQLKEIVRNESIQRQQTYQSSC